MQWLLSVVTNGQGLVDVNWDFWEVLGWCGNIIFGTRFFVQWWATERQKRVVVPTVFWWLSLVGSGLLLIYAIHLRKLPLIFSYLFTWVPYTRSLIIGYRMKRAEMQCVSCQTFNPGHARFCAHCGARLSLAGGEVQPA